MTGVIVARNVSVNGGIDGGVRAPTAMTGRDRGAERLRQRRH
jgi:hypothetical protein